MGRKAKQKKETRESVALKKMRAIRGYSQLKTAELIGVSKTSVNHYEAGWDSIPQSYIVKFIKALEFKQSDWKYILNNEEIKFRLRSNCISIIDQLDGKKLQAVYGLLGELV